MQIIMISVVKQCWPLFNYGSVCNLTKVYLPAVIETDVIVRILPWIIYHLNYITLTSS